MEAKHVDPEAEFLASKRESRNEWELFKENVRPLKRGRNAAALSKSLQSQADPQLKKSLLQHRRRMIEAIDEYKGEDPLQPWIDCIMWVQESFPAGGDYSGLVVIYEQCVRTFWHSDLYKEDLRYLKVWMEYADNCSDAELIYCFLEANQIGQTHSLYYISYASHMESKNKLRKADDIFNLGISRKAQPVEKIETAYKIFLLNSTKKRRDNEIEATENNQPTRSFGTVLATGDTRRKGIVKSDLALRAINPNVQRTQFSIYKDAKDQTIESHQMESAISNGRSWHTLGSRLERNKENTIMPSKWTSTKIPLRSGFTRIQPATTSTIEVFIDEEHEELPSSTNTSVSMKSSTLRLRRDGKDLKRETELLKKNPLRNFPQSSLPR